jgi:hypothetical protein
MAKIGIQNILHLCVPATEPRLALSFLEFSVVGLAAKPEEMDPYFQSYSEIDILRLEMHLLY